MREVVAEFERPVMLYSIGKDSSVMLRLAQKAFSPGRIPFPLLHVDTGLKFPEMYQFREQACREAGVKLRVYQYSEAIARNDNPWDLGTVRCCAALKTEALLNALREGNYDAALGGARREEERSRAKERIYSFRDCLWAMGTPRTSVPSCGVFIIAALLPVSIFGFSRFLTGPNSISGSTFIASRFQWYHYILLPNAK